MSYTELIIFEDGKANYAIEFSNAWGGSARIWTSLFDNYIPKVNSYDSWLTVKDNRLWDLAKRSDLPLFERAVHAFTFDKFYVKRENLLRMANDLKLFVGKYPIEGRVDHLLAWAKCFEDNQNVEAIGLYGTSVSENLWHRYKECPHCGNTTDETEGTPLSEGKEVYEFLSTKDKENE